VKLRRPVPSHYIKNTGCLRCERARALPRWPVGRQDASHNTTPSVARATPRHRHKLWSSCDYVWRGQERRSHMNVDCRGANCCSRVETGHSADASREASANLISSHLLCYGNFYTTLLKSKCDSNAQGRKDNIGVAGMELNG
jgi:hypothetical protein